MVTCSYWTVLIGRRQDKPTVAFRRAPDVSSSEKTLSDCLQVTGTVTVREKRAVYEQPIQGVKGHLCLLGSANQQAAQLKRAAETSQHTLFPDLRANGKNKAQENGSDQMADGFKRRGRGGELWSYAWTWPFRKHMAFIPQKVPTV